jgi:hypothetical protein
MTSSNLAIRLCEKPFFPLTSSRFDFDFFTIFTEQLITILFEISEIAIFNDFFSRLTESTDRREICLQMLLILRDMKLKQWLLNGQKSASKCAKIGRQMGGNRPPNG